MTRSAPSEPGRLWTTRRYRSGDEVDLLALFNREFGLQRSMEHWQWQFQKNPHSAPFIVVARRNSDDELVGSHIAMPVCLNVKGQKVLAGHSLDLVVHRDYRRQGIFEVTGRECFEWCAANGVRALFAFPNRSSYPGFARVLGWDRILFPASYSMRLGIASGRGGPAWLRWALRAVDAPLRAGRLLQLRVRRWAQQRRTPLRLAFEVASRVPEAHARLWKNQASLEVLSLWKDSRYLQWRYDENPDHRFEYAYVMDGEEIAALAVLHRNPSRLMICELIVRDRNVAVGQVLVTEICLRALRQGDASVAFLGHDLGFFRACLEGFRQSVAHENVFCGRGLQDALLERLVPHADNWSITYGDADFV